VADNDRAATLVGRAFASYPSSWDGPYTHGKWVYGPSFAVRLPDETGKYPVGKEWHKEILKKLVRSSAATDIVTIEDSKHEQTGLKTPCKFRAVRGTESHTALQFANLALGKLVGVEVYTLGAGPNHVLYGWDAGGQLVLVSATKRAKSTCLAW